MDIESENAHDTLTLKMTHASDTGLSRVVTIEIYDDGHDLVLFADGTVQRDVESAISLFSTMEPLSPDFDKAEAVQGVSSKIFYLKNNPSREKMRAAANFTLSSLVKNGFSGNIVDGWDS